MPEIEQEAPIWNREQQFRGSMRKYWRSRYNLFSRYDQGIILTKELWFSVTPESVSIFIARIIKAAFKDKCHNILDLFCGGGGNTIPFLYYFQHVYCLDNTEMHLQCTLNNARVYYDEEVITNHLKVIQCDWKYSIDSDEKSIEALNTQRSIKYLKSEKIDIVFGSPPWGGPSYLSSDVYNTDNLMPFRLEKLLRSLKQISDRIVLFLPKNSDLDQILSESQKVFDDDAVPRTFRMSINGHEKGLLCCWGEEFANVNLEDAKTDTIV
ncbi:hypothetical protein FOA43_004652 [Brettanomyces nanus]|uniref:Trimethylguanosine synthase n=1 Tax=Eeniella nana TaxID=13502 RepID=A0A875SB43_EENNA|nr:uncharacterized protein FOA43_004652 [Brettanomyces nanus]QPG77245.1 hypothetical protein FOA43_004652 [Brettanomyces nanus]